MAIPREHLRSPRRRLHSLSGRPESLLCHQHNKEVSRSDQEELPVFQIVATSPCPSTGHHTKEPLCILSYLYTLMTFLLSLLFFRLISLFPFLQPFNPLVLLLDCTQYVQVCLVLEGTELHTALQALDRGGGITFLHSLAML